MRYDQERMAKFGQVSLSIQNDRRIFASIKPGETWREKIGQRVFKRCQGMGCGSSHFD